MSGPLRARWLLGACKLAVLSTAVLTAACSGSQLKLTVTPEPAMNDRRPCYMLVRNVDDKQYLEETYQTVASKVMTPDDSVLESAVVFPGVPVEVEVKWPEKGLLAVYVLFTKPSGDWKMTVPASQAKLALVLHGSRLQLPPK